MNWTCTGRAFIKVNVKTIHDRRDQNNLFKRIHSDFFNPKIQNFAKKEMKSINTRKGIISSVLGTINMHSPSYGILVINNQFVVW